MFSQEVLTESKSARGSILCDRDDSDAISSLQRAKEIVLLAWKGKHYATTEQVAEYYEVSVQAIQNLVDRNIGEFGDELLKPTGTKLKELKNKLNISTNTRNLNIWSARAVLRVGLMLTESEVARKVRDVVLDVVTSPEVPLIDILRKAVPPVDFDDESQKEEYNLCTDIFLSWGMKTMYWDEAKEFYKTHRLY